MQIFKCKVLSASINIGKFQHKKRRHGMRIIFAPMLRRRGIWEGVCWVNSPCHPGIFGENIRDLDVSMHKLTAGSRISGYAYVRDDIV